MSSPVIGVVEAPSVATALRAAGFDVVSGKDFQSTAPLLQKVWQGGGELFLVVGDSSAQAIGAWLGLASKRCQGVVVLGHDVVGDLAEHECLVDTPLTLNDVLLALGGGEGSSLSLFAGGNELLVGRDLVVSEVEVSAASAPVMVDPVGEVDDRPEWLRAMFSDEGYDPVGDVVGSERVPEPVSADTSGLPDWFVNQTGSAAPKHAPVPEVVPAPTPEPEPAPVLEVAPAPEPIAEFVPPAPAPTPEPAPAPAPAPVSEFVRPAPAPAPVRKVLGPDDIVEELYEGAPWNSSANSDWSAAGRVAPPSPRQGFSDPMQEPARFMPPPFKTEYQVGDVFDVPGAPATAAPARVVRTGAAPVIISWAAKGGVGKTTNALNLAELAGRNGLRVVVIDANRGQPDFHKDLRLTNEPLPTMYDYAVGRVDADGVICPQEQLNRLPRALTSELHFSVVLGPPNKGDYAEMVSARHYTEVVDHVRHGFDLVIVDTQILESVRTDLWTEFLMPLLRSGAYGLGISGDSRAGSENLFERLNEFRAEGVPSGPQMVIATQYANFTEQYTAYFQQNLAGVGGFVGCISRDEQIGLNKNRGVVDPSLSSVEPVLSAVLAKVTGLSSFDTVKRSTPKTGKPSFLKWRR